MQVFRSREIGEELLVKELSQKGKAIGRSIYN
jgi:uncharacterized protein YuzE